MKSIIKYFAAFYPLSLLAVLPSCGDLLEKTPESSTSPASYLIDESHLMAYITNYYTNVLSTTGYRRFYFKLDDVSQRKE